MVLVFAMDEGDKDDANPGKNKTRSKASRAKCSEPLSPRGLDETRSFTIPFSPELVLLAEGSER